MKLSNQQIDALLAVMQQKHDAKHKEANKKKLAEARKKVEPRAAELMKIYEKMPTELKEFYGSYSKPNKEQLIHRLMKSVQYPSFDRSEMRNRILIASIDSATMDELKRKMNINL